MLKHPFHKILEITPCGSSAYILMMGRYSADNICAIADSLTRQANAEGIKIAEDCDIYILYLGPDKVPPLYRIMLPDGRSAMLMPVANGENAMHLSDETRRYVWLMEEAQFALQKGLSRDKTAAHYWRLHLAKCSTFHSPICFVHSIDEMQKDIYALRAMLKEQNMLPAKRTRGWQPKDMLNDYGRRDPYKELGLNRSDFR